MFLQYESSCLLHILYPVTTNLLIHDIPLQLKLQNSSPQTPQSNLTTWCVTWDDLLQSSSF